MSKSNNQRSRLRLPRAAKGRKPTGAEASAAIRWYYRLGQRLRARRTNKPMVKIAKDLGVGINAAYKALAFAEAYEPHDLNQLCQLNDSQDEAVLTWTHVIQLMSVLKKD